MMIRVNDVIISNTAGNMVSTVISATTCSERLQFWPAPAFCTVNTGMPADDDEIGAMGAIGDEAVDIVVDVVSAACAPNGSSASINIKKTRRTNLPITAKNPSPQRKLGSSALDPQKSLDDQPPLLKSTSSFRWNDGHGD
jgi:hypothetical protein